MKEWQKPTSSWREKKKVYVYRFNSAEHTKICIWSKKETWYLNELFWQFYINLEVNGHLQWGISSLHFKLVLYKYYHSFNFTITLLLPQLSKFFFLIAFVSSIKPNLLFQYFENLPGIIPRRISLPLQDPSLCVSMMSFSLWNSLGFYFCTHDSYGKYYQNDNKRGKNKWNTILKKHFLKELKKPKQHFCFFFNTTLELIVLDLPACYFRPLSHVASLNK